MDLIVYQVMAGLFCAGAIFALSFFMGYRTHFRKFKVRAACEREEMLTIERALKAFWDNEKQTLENVKKRLQQRIEFLESKLEQYRRKAAGIGMMGLRKSKVSDMLITLLIENESLEEKLFLQNLKLKQERDEFLESELRDISYKRVLLSEPPGAGRSAPRDGEGHKRQVAPQTPGTQAKGPGTSGLYA